MAADRSTGDPASGDPASGDPASGDAPVRGGARRRRLALLGGVAAVLLVSAGALVATAPWSPREPAAQTSPTIEEPTIEEPTGDPAGSPDDPAEATDDPSRSPPTSPGSSGTPAGFPDAATTGVPDGVTLAESGSIEVREDGAVIENLLIVNGSIEVYADDVTVRSVKITNDWEFVQWGVMQSEGHQGLVVEDSEIHGNPESEEQFASGISNHGGPLTVRRVEIHSITDGIVTSAGVIEDSYLHTPRYFRGDHTDMIQANGGPPDGLRLEIRHNTVINTEDQTGAVSLFDNVRDVRDVLVEDNLLAGGGYTFYGGGLIADGSAPGNIVVRDNVFSRRVFPDGGYWGPSAYFDRTAPGNVWSGNVWDDDGTEVVLEDQG